MGVEVELPPPRPWVGPLPSCCGSHGRLPSVRSCLARVCAEVAFSANRTLTRATIAAPPGRGGKKFLSVRSGIVRIFHRTSCTLPCSVQCLARDVARASALDLHVEEADPRQRTISCSGMVGTAMSVSEAASARVTSNLRNPCRKLSSLLIKGSDCALYGVNLPLLEIWLAALATDPGRHRMDRQVVAVPADMKGRRRASHRSSAANAVHDGFLVRKSLSHTSSVGRYVPMKAR